MSDPSATPWSSHPNAPQIPFELYLAEKVNFVGLFIAVIFYGIVIALFCQCMVVLLSPANTMKRGTKWTLVAHSVAMFSFLTIPGGINQNIQSVCYIDSRNFTGNDVNPPGPTGCPDVLFTVGTRISFAVMFPLNQWLADGLLLHRCWIIYSMNYWIMAFPCLIYLASIATGIGYIHQESSVTHESATVVNLGTPYLTISLSLTVLLTLMIITRLILHRRDLRNAMGASHGYSGLYIAVATTIVESYALYTIGLLAQIILWARNSSLLVIIGRAVGVVQVIAPYLIILRVAKRRALTSESLPGSVGSIRFRSQGTTDGDGSLDDEDPVNSMEVDDETPDKPGAPTKDAIEEVSL